MSMEFYFNTISLNSPEAIRGGLKYLQNPYTISHIGIEVEPLGRNHSLSAREFTEKTVKARKFRNLIQQNRKFEVIADWSVLRLPAGSHLDEDETRRFDYVIEGDILYDRFYFKNHHNRPDGAIEFNYISAHFGSACGLLEYSHKYFKPLSSAKVNLKKLIMALNYQRRITKRKPIPTKDNGNPTSEIKKIPVQEITLTITSLPTSRRNKIYRYLNAKELISKNDSLADENGNPVMDQLLDLFQLDYELWMLFKAKLLERRERKLRIYDSPEPSIGFLK